MQKKIQYIYFYFNFLEVKFMKNKFKRALAVASSIVSLSTMSQVKASGDIIKETEFLGLSSLGLLSILYGAKHQGIDSKSDTSDSKFNKISKSRQNKQAIIQKKNTWLVDDQFLKSFFDQKLNEIKNNPNLYNDISSYDSTADKYKTVISKDIPRTSIPGVDSVVVENLKQIISKVLLYTHGVSGADYYQGYSFVCMGIAFMIKQCYPSLDGTNAAKLCSSVYSSLLPILNQNMKELEQLDSEKNQIPKSLRQTYEKLIEKRKETRGEIILAMKVALPRVICGAGLSTMKLPNGLLTKAFGSEILKSLLLYRCGAKNEDQLNNSLTKKYLDVCEEFLNSI